MTTGIFEDFKVWKNGNMTDREFESRMRAAGFGPVWERFTNCEIGTSDLAVAIQNWA